MRFDYYSATVPEYGNWAIGALIEAFEAPDSEVRNCRGMHGYAHGRELVTGGQRIAFAWWNEGEQQTHIQASGAPADQVSEQIRAIWPHHRVSRADVCEDFRGGRPVWLVLRDAGIRIAQDCHIRTKEISDPAKPEEGRTLYLGSETSVMRARIYEKGLHPEARAHSIPPDVVRLEYQVRPASRAKSYLATLHPDSIPAGSRWAERLAIESGQVPGERWKPGTIWAPANLERSVKALASQYGQILETLRSRLGTWEGVGSYLGERVQEARRERLSR